ncbi:MAG: hypothetical protein U5K74_09380 [Gemmatimonadaceae bacterium]|nr:hypothetical protein [Gemmatimonadaceae bacterium]
MDFVELGTTLTAIEVRSGRAPQAHAGTEHRTDPPTRTLRVGGDGIPVEEVLSRPVSTGLALGPEGTMSSTPSTAIVDV